MLNEKIKEIREKQGCSVYKLAKTTGLSATYLHELERGLKQPTITTLEKICTALNLTLSEFFSEDEPELRPALRELLSTTETLPDDKVQALITAAKAMK